MSLEPSLDQLRKTAIRDLKAAQQAYKEAKQNRFEADRACQITKRALEKTEARARDLADLIKRSHPPQSSK